jgi:hypothetical protein
VITVIENQSLIDIAIQQDGSALCAFDWAAANGLSITDVLTPGQQLIEPLSDYRNVDVANYFGKKSQKIAASFIPIAEDTEDFELPGEFPLSF